MAPVLAGVPFNDAYWYMDWLLTVLLLLVEIILVMKLDDKVFAWKSLSLGFGSALFALASMMATILFLWIRVSAVKAQYQSVVFICGLIIFIAACH